MATAVNVLQWGHFARRRDTSGAYLQGLGPEIDPGRDVHADALVESRRAGRALRVDAERDLRGAVGVQRVERLAEQRLAETLSPVLTAGAEDVDPAEPEIVDRAQRAGRDIVAGADQETEVVRDLPRNQPLLVGADVVVPVVLEGVLEDLVELALLPRSEGVGLVALGPGRRRGLVVQLDHHPEERSDRIEAASPEEAGRPFVL